MNAHIGRVTLPPAPGRQKPTPRPRAPLCHVQLGREFARSLCSHTALHGDALPPSVRQMQEWVNNKVSHRHSSRSSEDAPSPQVDTVVGACVTVVAQRSLPGCLKPQHAISNAEACHVTNCTCELCAYLTTTLSEKGVPSTPDQCGMPTAHCRTSKNACTAFGVRTRHQPCRYGYPFKLESWTMACTPGG